MSKSTPTSSSTVQQFNPEQIAQAQHLGGLWDTASMMAGMSGGPPVGQSYLDNLRSAAQNNFDASAGMASNAVPSALNFANQALRGQLPADALPASAQMQNLNQLGGMASGAGTNYGNQIAGAAYGAPGVVAPSVGGLSSIAGQYAPLMGTGYQLGGALQGFGQNAAAGGQQALGALGGLAPAAMSIANPAIGGLYGNAGMAVGGNPIYDSLRGMASGQYVDPSRNPALPGALEAATRPLVNQFMTATAPQTDSNYEGGGRFGSGVLANARNQNQYNLGQGLAGATSGIVNNAYNTGLQSMLGAGQALGSAFNTGIGNATNAFGTAGQLGQAGIQNAGNLIGQGYQGYQSGLQNAGSLTGQAGQTIGNLAQTGLGGAASALQAGGQLGLGGQQALQSGLTGAAGAANQGYGTGANAYNQAGALANAGMLGLGSIAQMAPDLANFPLSQATAGYNSMWAPIQNYAALLGQPLGGSTPSSSTTTGQAYTNTGSQVASGLSSLASLAMLFKI